MVQVYIIHTYGLYIVLNTLYPILKFIFYNDNLIYIQSYILILLVDVVSGLSFN